MKTHLIYLSLLLFSLALNAESLPPATTAPLYVHLYEINEQWLTETSPVGYLEAVSFADDSERIRTHLRLVEGILRQRATEHLTAKQRARRTRVLDHLRTYWQAGLFPRNDYRPERIPVFVDAHNTACAVGHLLRETGAAALVERIRQENNFADLQELLTYAAVPEWAEAHGFTAAELAWIQPSYAVIYFTPYIFGNDLGITGGRVNDLKVYDDELYFAGSFSAVDGHDANKLTIWNGSAFRNLPGLDDGNGRIDRIAFDEATGDLYAIGMLSDFPEMDSPVVFARYRSDAWEALLTATDIDSGGHFTDLIYQAGKFYLSGSFSHISSDSTIQALAIYDITADTWASFNENMHFTGILRDMDISGDSLLVGGSMFLIEGSDTLAANIALLDLADGEVLNGGVPHFDEYGIANYMIVDFDHYGENYVFYYFVGTNINGSDIITYANDLTGSFAEPLSLQTPAVLSGYLEQSNYLYGALDFDYLDEGTYAVINTLPGASADTYWSIVYANGAISAMTGYQNEFIIAGEFTEIDGIEINQLTRADLLISDTEDFPTEERFTLTTDGKYLFLQNVPELLPTPARLELFDMAGRRVWSSDLSGRSGNSRIHPERIIAGSYAYRLLLDDEVAVGQVVLVR